MTKVHLENMDKYFLMPNPVPRLICCVRPNPQRHFILERELKAETTKSNFFFNITSGK